MELWEAEDITTINMIYFGMFVNDNVSFIDGLSDSKSWSASASALEGLRWGKFAATMLEKLDGKSIF